MADALLTVYEKPTCTTCRKLVELLRAEGVDFDRVDYYVEPLGKEKLRELVRKTGRPARELLRAREAAGRDSGLTDPSTPEEAILDAIVADPDLLQRPIVERGDRAVLARPVERVRELLRDAER